MPATRSSPRHVDAATASRLAQRALANIAQPYPYHAAHVQLAAGDLEPAHVLHPAFCGSFDWHSCVHMHWTLARLRRLHPALAEARAIDQAFDARLTPANLRAEAAYFARPGTQSFERTYGWAWLLALAGEVDVSADQASLRWTRALAPLVEVIVARYQAFLPRARYPIRHGMHANSAFGLVLALDYARQAREGPLAETIEAKALEWFAADRDLPVQWEPSGADFLSPALVEAELMRRVLAPADFAAWLALALPALDAATGATAFMPVEVSDRSDPQIVHLDGLNLSRAWCLRGIAAALPPRDPRRAGLCESAQRHLDAGLQGLASGDYVGTHWLATFALLALTAE
jgi:hypothetical protein